MSDSRINSRLRMKLKEKKDYARELSWAIVDCLAPYFQDAIYILCKKAGIEFNKESIKGLREIYSNDPYLILEQIQFSIDARFRSTTQIETKEIAVSKFNLIHKAIVAILPILEKNKLENEQLKLETIISILLNSLMLTQATIFDRVALTLCTLPDPEFIKEFHNLFSFAESGLKLSQFIRYKCLVIDPLKGTYNAPDLYALTDALYQTIASYYINIKKFDEADQCLEQYKIFIKSIPQNHSLNPRTSLASYYLAQSFIASQKNDFSSARDYVLKFKCHNDINVKNREPLSKEKIIFYTRITAELFQNTINPDQTLFYLKVLRDALKMSITCIGFIPPYFQKFITNNKYAAMNLESMCERGNHLGNSKGRKGILVGDEDFDKNNQANKEKPRKDSKQKKDSKQEVQQSGNNNNTQANKQKPMKPAKVSKQKKDGKQEVQQTDNNNQPTNPPCFMKIKDSSKKHRFFGRHFLSTSVDGKTYRLFQVDGYNLKHKGNPTYVKT